MQALLLRWLAIFLLSPLRSKLLKRAAALVMGGGASRREPEVHVVVVQSQENGKMDAKLLRQTFVRTGEAEKGQESTMKVTEYEEHSKTGDLETYSGSGQHKNSSNKERMSDTTRKAPPNQLTIPKAREQYQRGRWRHLSDSSVASYQSINENQGLTPDPYGACHEDTRVTPYYRSARRLHPQQPSTRDQYGRSHQQQQSSSYQYGYSSADESIPEEEVYSPRRSSQNLLQLQRKQSVDRGRAVTGSNERTSGGHMFELFRTYDGEEYTVYVREDGKRFYVDFEEQKWRYFPDTWNERGSFLPIDYDPYNVNNEPGTSQQFTDNREGEFVHPTRGKLITYLRHQTLNVLYFFDEMTGSWLPMPLSWERHVPDVSTMITDIQKSYPGWKDVKSIVAMLRCCNYNQDDCITMYQSINDDGVLDYSDYGPGRDPFRSLTEKKLKETTAQFNEAKESQKKLKDQLEQLQNKVEELEMENEQMKRELDSSKEEQRRKSRVLRQSMNISSRMIKMEMLRPLIQILGEDARALRAKVTALRNTAVKGLKSYRATLGQFSKALSQLIVIHRRQSHEIHEVRALYRKEALQRKLLYNEVQELRGNIRVFCRCRNDDSDMCALTFDGDERVICTTVQGRKKVFEFEKMYTPDTSQETVFEDTKPIITSCVDGYNVCIIAYGQTGAGKTYTMMGPRSAPGVNIRSMKELFKICTERKRIKYTMKVSMVEVYNESVYDVLVSPEEGHEKLQLQKKGNDVIVPGLLEIEVRSMEDVMMIFNEGEKNRTVASTKMNTNSSRSHLLFMLKVEGHDTVSRATSRGRLTLVDLAGSERISRSEATGIRLVEAAAINKSLSALGQVFASIRNNALHIPYRNSKLTYLLQPCIGGDSKACMFVNISPLESNMAETISSLEFGQNARQVELGKATKHVTKGS